MPSLSQPAVRPRSLSWIATLLCASALWMHANVSAQTLIYQEGFNDDGEKANPPRYTTTGREAFEVPRIISELNNADQKGPIYWAHNFDVSFVGIPAIPARRMIFAWTPANDTTGVSQDFLNLFRSSVKWLVKDKAGATVVVAPDVATIGGLADALTSAGYKVVDDDPAVQDDAVQGDVLIHAGGGNASRFARSPKPVIVMVAADYDDMIVGSIGSAVSFEPGPVEITTPGHPAAGGKTGTFNLASASLSFQLTGRFLPEGATRLATVVRRIPPAVTRLTDVDDMIAGTKQSQKSTGKVTEIDFSDNSTGSFPFDNALPGGEAGNWAVHVRGKLTVATAGTYTVAIGSDDGARLAVDLDRNGLTAADILLEDFGPHGYLIQYENITFPSSGTFDFQIMAYNSGGGGSLEFAVSKTATGGLTSALDSGEWDLVGASDATSPVKLQAPADVTGFVATGATTEAKEPIIVLMNGPDDNPPGFFYGGGPFEGFEGKGFWGASGLNKWPYPDGQGYRSLRLRPVDVTGKKNVKLTVALAGSQIDTETSDFLDIIVYPKGPNSTPITLAHFQGVENAVQPWMADQKERFRRRLTKQFADFEYSIPADATELIVEFRAATTWWNELVAFDNVRITSGEATQTAQVKAALEAGKVSITFTGTLQSAASITGPWTDVANAKSPFVIEKANLATAQFYRVR